MRMIHPRSWFAFSIVWLMTCSTSVAFGFSEDQWQCVAGPNGEWDCSEIDAAAGPFEPVDTAPIYSRREAQEAARGLEGVILGQTTEQAELTWVPRQALPADVRAGVPEWCGGAYQEFPWTDDMLAADPATAILGLSANRAEYLVNREATLEGSVLVEQGARRLGADVVRWDEEQMELTLEGDVRVTEPGVLLRGEMASVDVTSGAARFEDARFVFYEGEFRGSAETLERIDDEFIIQDGEFTRCEPGHEGWKIAAGHIEIPEDSPIAVARNARLEVYDVPVLWTPYIAFPVTDERQSGFLFPTFGYGSEDGFEASVPYYLNLAPNYDATVIPAIMTERGVSLETEVRHMNRFMRNTVGGLYMPTDDNYNGELSFDEFVEQVQSGRRAPGFFRAKDRWLGHFQHDGRWLPGIRTHADITAVSDDDYFRDLSTELSVNAQTELSRTAGLSIRRGGLDAHLWVQDIQQLDDNVLESHQRMPQLDISWEDRFGDVPMIFGVDAQYAYFDLDDQDAIGAAGISGSRVHIVPRFRIPVDVAWGWGELDVAWQYTRWELEDEPLGTDDGPSRTLPMVSFDGGLRFERDTSIGGLPLLQTLEPRIHYLYIEDENQDFLPNFDTAEMTFTWESLFRENRFSGIDRIGDANQLTVAMGSRLLSRSDGTELVGLNVGRVYYFDNRDVTLSGNVRDRELEGESGWVTDLVVRLGSGLDARALWVWDNENGEQDQTNVYLRYVGDERRLFNIGYRERGNDIRQVDVAFLWPFRPQVAVIGRLFYDLEEEETIEAFGGVQYDDCCWRVRVVGRQFRRTYESVRDTDTDTGVFFEVIMKGLAGFDSGIESILRDGIHGYRETARDGIQL